MRSLEEILAEETEFVVGIDLAGEGGLVGVVVFEINQSVPGTLTRVLGPEHVPAFMRPVLFDQDAPDPVLRTSVDSHRYDPTVVDEELKAWNEFQADWKAREERLRAQRRNRGVR